MTTNLSPIFVTFSELPAVASPDFTFDFGGFNDTTIKVEAITEAGKTLFSEMFGAGAVSVELPKSRGEDFAQFVQRKGLNI